MEKVGSENQRNRQPLTRDQFVTWHACLAAGESYWNMSEGKNEPDKRSFEVRGRMFQEKADAYINPDKTKGERFWEDAIDDSVEAEILTPEDAETIRLFNSDVASVNNPKLKKLRDDVSALSTKMHTQGTPEYEGNF